jgi:DNA invertase Pin-like site-specific DNA recombinase
VLVVVDMNRLTRTSSIEERAAILGPFQRLGISIVAAGMMLDLGSMDGEFVSTVQALVSAQENAKRIAAIKRGKDATLAQGGRPAGPTPFGYIYTRATDA